MVIFSLGVETFSVLLNVPQESKITDLVSALPAGYRLQLTGKVSFDPHSLACTQLPPRRSTPPHQSTPDKITAHQPSTSSEEVEATTEQPDSESFSPVVADSVASFSGIEENKTERDNRSQEVS